MRRKQLGLLLIPGALILGAAALGSRADDVESPAPAPVALPATAPPQPALANPVLTPEPAWSPRPPRPPAKPPIVAADASEPATDGDQGAQVSSEAKWQLAGYNNNELVYTIFITSHDNRILRCIIELNGSYYENGEKHSVSDRQSTTVFPEQRVQIGNWQGLDEKSGASYGVKCHRM